MCILKMVCSLAGRKAYTKINLVTIKESIMDIKEYKALKLEVENEMSKTLQSFADKTGLDIEDIGVIKTKFVASTSKYQVRLQVQL